MSFLINLLIIWAGISFGYSFISNNPLLWFVWVPLGFITTIILVILWLYCVVLPIAKRTNPNSKFRDWYTVHVIKFVNLMCGAKVVVEGRENLCKDKKVLYVANHKSNLDPLLMFEAMDRAVAAAAKSDLMKIALIRPFFRAYNMIIINRSSDREAAKSIVEGIKYMKQGYGMILFPEGGVKTREVEQMVSIKPGAYKLAIKSEAVIQPVVIIGSSKLCNHKLFQPRKKIIVRILPAISYEEYKDLNTHEIAYKVVDQINAHFPHEERVNIEEEN